MPKPIHLPDYDDVLLAELNQLVEMLRDNLESSLIRRMYILSAVAYIEGRLFVLKNYLVKLHRSFVEEHGKGIFTELDVCALLEITPNLGSSKVKERPLMSPLIDNIKFTLNTFARVFSLDWTVPKDDRWNRIKALKNARNRLTHPKSDADLTVSDEDLENAATGTSWFDDMRVQLIHEARKKSPYHEDE